jgi:hypothetical protein
MKQLILIILVIFHMTNSIAGEIDGKIGSLPHAESNGLVLAALVTRESVARGTEQIDSQVKNYPIVYIVNAYLINRGKSPITVLLGKDDQVGTVWNGTTMTVVYSSTFWDGFSDISLKPRIDDYRPIQLAPGEASELPTKRFESIKEAKKIRVYFGTTESFKKYYSVWIGSVAVEVPNP